MSWLKSISGRVGAGGAGEDHGPTGFDALIIGAGHNGLVCAGYLAKAGRPVLVLEASDIPGGVAQSGSIGGEAVSSRCAHIVRDLDEGVVKDLHLTKHGLTYAAQSLPTYALDYDGAHIMLTHNLFQAADTIRAHSERDANHFPDFIKQVQRFSAVARSWNNQTPGRLRGIFEQGLAENLSADAYAMRDMGRAFAKLSKADQQEFFRFVVSSVGDHLDRAFETDLLKGAIAFDGILGQSLGAYSPGTAWSLAQTWTGEIAGRRSGVSVPALGMGKLVDALVGALNAHGGQIRCRAEVEKILVEHGRTVGVELSSGERIYAPMVVSATDPKTTLLDMLGREHMETDLAANLSTIKQQGCAVKINLILSRLPRIVGFTYNQNPPARYLIAPSLDYLERAYNPVKYGEFSDHPAMEILFPTLSDPGLVTRHEQVMSIVVQYAPYDLNGGWAERKEDFVANCLDVIGNYMSDLREHIIGGEVLTPVDLEAEFNLRGGHWHHGDFDLSHQLMLRPAPGIAQYLGPVRGLYLCGAGTHPGGGITGRPGKNAAERILRDKIEPLKTIRPAKRVDEDVVPEEGVAEETEREEGET